MAASNAWAGRPAVHIPGSTANYWQLDYSVLANMQWVVHPVDAGTPIFKEPHMAITGTVKEVLSESDGDHHFWLIPDGTSKDQLACEITPQNPLTPPPVGAHILVCGIYRYDLQHGWSEVHPVDHYEVIP